jgi:ABC-type phosphate transport system auxiliary subunit
MSFFTKLGQAVNVPVAMQVIGVVIFGLTIWKGVHHFWPSFGLIAGAAMAYVGRHYNTLYNIYKAERYDASHGISV